MTQPTEIQIDVQEHGANQQTLNQRLYMQLQVFGDCHDAHVMAHALKASGIEGVLYRDLNDPMGIGILAMHQDPDIFRDYSAGSAQLRSLPAAPPEAEYDDGWPDLCFRVRG